MAFTAEARLESGIRSLFPEKKLEKKGAYGIDEHRQFRRKTSVVGVGLFGGWLRYGLGTRFECLGLGCYVGALCWLRLPVVLRIFHQRAQLQRGKDRGVSVAGWHRGHPDPRLPGRSVVDRLDLTGAVSALNAPLGPTFNAKNLNVER